MMKGYGEELILDLKECDPSTFNRTSIATYFTKLCRLIDMEMQDRYFWDDVGVPEEDCQTEPHLKGTSAIQFIKTSNITIHTLDILKTAYINIFSCKDFDKDVASEFSIKWFKGSLIHRTEVGRG